MLLWPFAAFLLSVYSCWYQQQPVDLVGAGSILRFQLSCLRYVREPDQRSQAVALEMQRELSL